MLKFFCRAFLFFLIFISYVFANPQYETILNIKPYGMHICVATMPYMLYTENNNNRCEPVFSESDEEKRTVVDEFLVSGSKVVSLNHEEETAKKTSTMEDNPETWVSLSNVVYVDMVGNGFFP